MPVSHLLLTLLVVVVWGLNFLLVKVGLTEVPPLLLCTLRFFFASVPAIFFIKPPDVPFKLVASYGLFMFVLQFGFIFFGMNVGMPAGMASLIIQVQIFFSLLFSAVFLGEKPAAFQIAGSLVSFAGIALVSLHLDADMSVLGFVLVLAASASWGYGNLITKKMQTTNLLAVVVWANFLSIFPMLLLTFAFEGLSSFTFAYEHISWRGIAALTYIVYASTWLGYGVWTWLIARYSIGLIVPFVLLVPVVGMLGSTLLLGEPFQSWKMAAALLVISGLGISLFGSRLPAKVEPELAS
jgi:O-acetylserine/cysteine efflux transporter